MPPDAPDPEGAPAPPESSDAPPATAAPTADAPPPTGATAAPPTDPAATATTADRPARAPAGELLSALSAVALFVAMFATKWYGVVALPHVADRSGRESASSAWTELTDVRWLLLLTILVTLGSVVIHITQRSHGSQTDTSRLVTLIGTVTAALLVVRVLIDLPSPASVVDAKLGAYLGLLAAMGIAVGGFESVRAQRLARRRLAHRPPRSRPPLATQPPAE